ncbi:PAS domain-containing protein [Cytophaga aurantiaca]|uniref:PAS domain-containing protein n=1 Tax=Cytophaga aurantiaca TaxID=29530 RepID=UPI00036A24F4|nr:PAS domain-containing protein [Cytophaga aurantiaca]
MTGELHEKKNDETTLDTLIEGFQLISFDWRYLYVNDAVVKHSKYTREELLGYTMMEKYPGIEKTPMFDLLKQCMKERKSDCFENEFTYPDNSKGWFELRIQPVSEGLFILSIDITERKKVEEERIEYIHGLEQMLFITSHKVRQPVTQIMGMSELLNATKSSREDLLQITDYMKQSINSLDSFTQELTLYMNSLHDRFNNDPKMNK